MTLNLLCKIPDLNAVSCPLIDNSDTEDNKKYFMQTNPEVLYT